MVLAVLVGMPVFLAHHRAAKWVRPFAAIHMTWWYLPLKKEKTFRNDIGKGEILHFSLEVEPQTLQFALVSPCGAQVAQMLPRWPPDASRCSQMLPDASQMLPDASICFQMPPDASSFQMPPRCPEMLPRCFQMLLRCFRMVPDARQMPPDFGRCS